MASKLRLLVLGAPGSGKGTISSRIVRDFNLKHLSSGDILRDNINRKTPVGAKVQELVAKGEFVPDNMITKIVLNELAQLKFSSWLLDGFPRTLNQAQALDKENLGLDRIVNLNVPFNIIINRLQHRWVHPSSGRVYNLEFNPPKVANRDDVTGERLVQREDDHPDVVLRRLKDYESRTKPIIDYYTKQNLVDTYSGETSDSIWPMIKADIGKLAAKKNAEERRYMNPEEKTTHTGQHFAEDDPSRVRFMSVVTGKQTNERWAIDLVAKDPVVVTDERTVMSSGGGALGHPKVYINVDKNQVHVCDYSGRRFIKRKFYDPKVHGECVEYDVYLEQVARLERLELGV